MYVCIIWLVVLVEVLGSNNSKAASISKVFKSLLVQDLTWTALLLSYHQLRLVACFHQHALSVILNQMEMGSMYMYILRLSHVMCSSHFLSHNQCLFARALASEYFDRQRFASDKRELHRREVLHTLRCPNAPMSNQKDEPHT